ncbi:hypothetical protein [Streptomyces sp. NPDC059063]|uniref:hypothetical protein n=1 Tax=Streptomyces sp. NPDC059063 TaxID=3346712 RepID=UPI00367C54FB
MTGLPGADRAYCTCTEVRNYDYAEAAEKLGCKPRFLKDRIRSLPHQKLGESVAFCDCELRLIQRRFTVVPDPASSARESAAAAPTLRSIKPARRRSSAIAATG